MGHLQQCRDDVAVGCACCSEEKSVGIRTAVTSPVDTEGNAVPKDDPQAQIRQVFSNLTSALVAAGATI